MKKIKKILNSIDGLKESMFCVIDDTDIPVHLNILLTSFICLLGPLVTIVSICILPFVIIMSVLRNLYNRIDEKYFKGYHLKDNFIDYFNNLKSKKFTYYLATARTDNNYFSRYGQTNYIPDENLNITVDLQLKDFILKFLQNYNKEYFTFCGKRYICDLHRRRSLGDIYRICKNYYPDCKPEQVLKYLIDLNNEGYIGGSYCNTINRFVFHDEHTQLYIHNRTEYSDNDNIRFADMIKYIKTLKLE